MEDDECVSIIPVVLLDMDLVIIYHIHLLMFYILHNDSHRVYDNNYYHIHIHIQKSLFFSFLNIPQFFS